MLRPEVARRVTRVIDRHHLHTALPVPIRQVPVDLDWQVVYRERIHPLYAALAVDGPRHVLLVNASIGPEWQRLGIAHEIGHAIEASTRPSRPPAQLHLLAEEGDLWWERPGERNANVIAAQLLIPERMLDEPADAIAAACEVPVQFAAWRLASLRRPKGDPVCPITSDEPMEAGRCDGQNTILSPSVDYSPYILVVGDSAQNGSPSRGGLRNE